MINALKNTTPLSSSAVEIKERRDRKNKNKNKKKKQKNKQQQQQKKKNRYKSIITGINHKYRQLLYNFLCFSVVPNRPPI